MFRKYFNLRETGTLWLVILIVSTSVLVLQHSSDVIAN